MDDATTVTQTPKPRRWLRRLIWTAGVLVVLLVAIYFVATSSAFFKSVVLPRVGSALNADVTVADAFISPFKEVVLRNLKVQPRGAETLFTAAQVQIRYSLLDIIGGKVNVSEIVVDSPVVSLVENADGTSNLDPILKAQKKQEKTPAAAKPSQPQQINVQKIALNNATIRQLKNLKGGGRNSIELASVNVTLSNLKNGTTGKLNFTATMTVSNTSNAPAGSGSLQAKIDGDFSLDLTKDLKPGAINGGATLAVSQAAGNFADFATLATKLVCDATPTEIRQVALNFTKGGAALGTVRVSGPFEAEKMEGRLKVEVLSLDRQVLNLAGAASGMDFGTTTVNATNEVNLTKGGSVISAAGRWDVGRFQVTRRNQTTPTLDLRCDYSVSVNSAERSALLTTLNLTATQNQSPLLQGGLTSPMPISWGSADNAVGDATLSLTLTNLNLADWKAFASEAAPEGVANATLKLVSQQGGKRLAFDLDSQVVNLAANAGSNRISQLGIHLIARGQGVDFKQFTLTEYRLDVARQSQPALSVSGSGTFDAATKDADLQVAAQVMLSRVAQFVPQPDLNVASGAIDFKGRITSKQENQTMAGQLTLTDLNARFGNNQIAGLGVNVDFDAGVKGKQLEIRKVTGQIRQNAIAGGSIDGTGNFDSDKQTGQLTLKLSNLNQDGLRPFLQSALGDMKLVSVSINATASASYSAQGDAAFKADLQVTNLVVSDPKNQLPASPLEARVQFDTSVRKQVAEVRRFQLALTPTPRAKNELDLKGTVDFSRTNAISGSLKLAAAALDVTRYYDLFEGKSKPGTTVPATQPQPVSTAHADPNKEPDAVKLPFKNFTFDASIGQFYLREMTITNLLCVAKLDDSHVVITPCQLALNGAPVNANLDLDLGVPGYKYGMTFNAQHVPLAPLVNTFQPDRKGQIGGALTASAKVNGAGMTGANLKKNLTGQFDLASTNLNFSIANVRSPMLNTLINVVVSIPDLLRNPAAALGSFVGRLTGAGGTRSGWADELTASPIDVISARGSAGNGEITLQDSVVRSAAFQAQAKGVITLQDIRTNSTLQIPITVSLSRSLSDKAGLAPAGTPTNAAYVPLPDFVAMKGTVGKPSPDINKVVLLQLAAKAGSGVANQIGGAGGDRAGSILNAVGGLLGGGSTTPAPAGANTSIPSTNQPPAQQQRRGLLDLLGPPR